MTPQIDASQMLDTVEGCYAAFRRRLRNIRLSSRSVCNACRALPKLDLKFVVHHGEVARHRVAGREELAGREVILVHRLLKNSVEAVLGGKPYALFTDQCLAAMGKRPEDLGLVRHSETIDLIGEVGVWLHDLEAVWLESEERDSYEVMPEKALGSVSVETRAPPQLVWDLITNPDLQPKWMSGTDTVVVASGGARRGGGDDQPLHARQGGNRSGGSRLAAEHPADDTVGDAHS